MEYNWARLTNEVDGVKIYLYSTIAASHPTSHVIGHLATGDSFNGKPQATTATWIPVACGLPLNEECVTDDETKQKATHEIHLPR